MNDIEKLFVIEEIKQIKVCYFCFIDIKSFEEFKQVFVEDVVFDFIEVVYDLVMGNFEGVEFILFVEG